MNNPSATSTATDEHVLNRVSLDEPPFCGAIFSPDTIRLGQSLVDEQTVRIVTINLQG
ncbi:MAG: hypothetical protein HKN23_11510, partial [Verrucomicrobiales bacterium]|nr:hypothetical protein [Verrucomicrobiales bacterium]